MADNKAAFGVFPQMKPRRSKQDREAAKSFPLDVARGFVAGALGTPADILNIPAAVYSMATGKDMPYEVPYGSEHFQQVLPGKPTTPTGEAASGLGALAGGFYTGPGSGIRAAMAVPKAAVKAGKDFIMAAPQGAPRMFIGPKAKTWDQAKADRAAQMEKEGKDPVDIWRETGTFRGADGIQRQEISDQPAKFLTDAERKSRVDERKAEMAGLKEKIAPTPQKDLFPKALNEAKKDVRDEISMIRSELKGRSLNPRTTGIPAPYIFEHPELYKAYPELYNLKINTEMGGNALGSLSILPSRGNFPGKLEMDISTKGLRRNPTSTALHEMQHAVQTLEGMTPGGNPTFSFTDPRAHEMLQRERLKMLKAMPYEDFVRQGGYTDMAQAGKDYAEYTQDLQKGIDRAFDRMLQERVAMDYYRRLGGEAEARATQARQMMSPSQRQQEFPYSSYDILPEEIIVKPPREFKEGGEVKMQAGGIARLAKSLKGAQQVLPQAEREANLAKMLEESAVKERMYHGTQKSFDQFKKNEIGHWFSDSSNVANKYAKSSEEGAQVYPVFLSLKNPLVVANRDEYNAMMEKAWKQGLRGVSELAKRNNYDGVMIKDSGYVNVFEPTQIKSATGNRGTYDTSKPELNEAKGGKVSFSDNLDAMMMDVEDRKMGVGGLLRRGAKAAKSEPALPLELPRAPAKTKEEIRPVAQRMAQQMTGEFVRPNPKKSINPAGKSLKQFQMEKELTHDIRPAEGVTLSPQQVADIEKQLGMLKIGVSGDTTIADQVLYRAGPYQLDLPSPQHGGPLYALGGEGAWASNNPTAATFQKRVQELSRAYGDAPTLGQFVAMGPEGSNFALHLADANLRAIDLSKMTKSQIEQANDIIRQGTAKSGPRPGFPGIEDKESAYLHFAFDPELRKAFNAMMNKPDYTSKLNLPDGRVILHAVTEPELRNTEILTSGRSQMMLDPSVASEALALSKHPTYSHVIPKVSGSEVSRTKYPIPAELEFPDVQAYIRENVPKKSHTRMYQTATPRQIIDQQHIDEMKMYEELMKEYTGKKKGGAVKKPDNGLIKVTKKRKAKA